MFPHAAGLAVDRQENLYATGYGAGTYDGLTLTNCGGLPDFFVAKCDGSGRLLWLRQLGSTREQRGQAIALDQSGGVYVIGSSREAAAEPVLSIGASTLTNVLGFVAQYDSAGNALWAKTVSTTASVRPGCIGVVEPEAIYVSGLFMNMASVGSFPLLNPNPDGWADVFLTKLAGIGLPQLRTTLRSGDKGLQFEVAGASGFPCAVEASTDLVHWVPLSTNSLPFAFEDRQATNFPARYYRAAYRP